MNIFSVFTFCGGLAFFIFGMRVMSRSIEEAAGLKFTTALGKMTDSRLKSVALGAGITALLQSSSAVTVMLIGLVDSGVIPLVSASGVIAGTNIGTTFTSWILSLSGIESENTLILFFNPENFSPLIAFSGVILFLFKKERFQSIGTAMLGFSVLMYGMALMKNSVLPLAESESFKSALFRFDNPLLNIIIGALFTAVIQSSSASVGVLQALSASGLISYIAAIPIIMGQNIGTCATALIASIGLSKNAKGVTAIHILFNVIGTAFFLICFFTADIFLDFGFMNNAVSPAGIALIHSIFNIVTALVFLPFLNILVRNVCG